MKAGPETPNKTKKKYPHAGSANNLKTDEIRDILKWSLTVFKVSAPPMDNIAKGRATAEDSFNALSIKGGKPRHTLAYKIPPMHASIRGLDIKALAV